MALGSEGKLGISDLTGGTFSLSNIGAVSLALLSTCDTKYYMHGVKCKCVVSCKKFYHCTKAIEQSSTLLQSDMT